MRDQIILDAKGFFFVYSITSPESFDEIETFIQRAERVKDCSIEGIGVLIGNKVDLEEEHPTSLKRERRGIGQTLWNPFL